MNATVLASQCCNLLVRDHSTFQEVFVRSNQACCFRAGDQVRVEYNGVMTMSLPPQITATNITFLNACGC